MATAAMSPPADPNTDVDIKIEVETKPALTPPTSEGTAKKGGDFDDDSGSELSDLEPERLSAPPQLKSEYCGEIVPDHYYDGGNIPVFKPVSLP